MGRYVPVGGFWYVGVELQPSGGMAEPALDYPGMPALLTMRLAAM